MLLLQILIIPIVVLLLLSTVFIIASLGMEMPRYISREDRATTRFDDSASTQSDGNTSLGMPLLKI